MIRVRVEKNDMGWDIVFFSFSFLFFSLQIQVGRLAVLFLTSVIAFDISFLHRQKYTIMDFHKVIQFKGEL